jgi:hypothetical protein
MNAAEQYLHDRESIKERNLSVWLRYVAQGLSWQKGHLDQSSWFAFLRGKSLGVNPNLALGVVARLITRAGDGVKEDKLFAQAARAYRQECPPSSRAAAVSLEIDPVNWSWVDVLAKRAAHVTPALLRNHSPIPVKGTAPDEYLSHIFKPGESLIIFDSEKSQGQAVWQQGAELNRFVHGQKNGVWFLIQPVDGRYHWNPRQGRPSRRSEEAITAWRYLLLESDRVAPSSWLKILVQLSLPIVSITGSGGTSRHALVRFPTASKEEWDHRRDKLKQLVVPLGACPGSLTAVRLSRLPNCFRADRLQELLWLDPHANGQPILEKLPI